jgi:hypothetical protein
LFTKWWYSNANIKKSKLWQDTVILKAMKLK